MNNQDQEGLRFPRKESKKTKIIKISGRVPMYSYLQESWDENRNSAGRKFREENLQTREVCCTSSAKCNKYT
jgi:hypothetical protein